MAPKCLKGIPPVPKKQQGKMNKTIKTVFVGAVLQTSLEQPTFLDPRKGWMWLCVAARQAPRDLQNARYLWFRKLIASIKRQSLLNFCLLFPGVFSMNTNIIFSNVLVFPGYHTVSSSGIYPTVEVFDFCRHDQPRRRGLFQTPRHGHSLVWCFLR